MARNARQALRDRAANQAWQSDPAGAASELECHSAERRRQLLRGTSPAGPASAQAEPFAPSPGFGLHELALAAAAAAALMATLLTQGASPQAPTPLGDLLAQIDSGQSLSEQQREQFDLQLPAELSKGYLRAAWNDPQLWESLALKLPDRARAASSGWARLIEPRGGITNRRPTFEFEYFGPPDSPLELVLLLSNGESHQWPVDSVSGVQRFAPNFTQDLLPGTRVAWTLQQPAAAPAPLTPARFQIVEAKSPTLNEHAIGLSPEEQALLRAALFLENENTSAALFALNAITDSDNELKPSIRHRARLLRAAAHAIRGEEELFRTLAPGGR